MSANLSSLDPASGPAADRRQRAGPRDALVRLNELSSRLWRARTLHDGLQEMLAASLELLGTDMGHVRLMDASRDVLLIAAHRGFDQKYIDAFHESPVGETSASARALRTGERCVIEDVETDAAYAPLRPVARAAGFRAVQSTPLLSHAGKPVGIVSTHFRSVHSPGEQELRMLDLYVRQAGDFIERFNAEEALRASEARYRAVVENQSEMVCRFRSDGTILFVNGAYAHALGTTVEALMGGDFWRFVAEKDRAAVRAMLTSMTPESPVVRIENRFTTREGERWTLWTNRGLKFDRDGRLLEAQSSGIEITERKRFEQALAASVQRMEALYELTDRLQRSGSVEEVYETSMDAISKAVGCERASILLFDEAGVMRFAASRGLSTAYRKAVEGHTPWQPDEKDPRPFGIADVACADMSDVLGNAIRSEGIAALAFIPLVMERQLIGKFMVYFDTPHVFSESDYDVALTISHQVAFAVQRRHAEEERRRAEEALRENDRRKDEFLATLSHELRNPLAPLKNAVEVLRLTDTVNPSAAPLQEMMARQINHLVRLVDDLLETSRISRGTLVLQKQRLELANVVRNALETSDPLIRAARHRLEVRLPERALWVDGDAVRLAQILSNLLNNAAKYTDPGGAISVSVAVHGGNAAISVRDTGTGIAPELLSRVFEMFSRGEQSASRGDAGLGIGLALARRLAEMHGGTIAAHSGGKGKGSEFVVQLPLAPEPRSAAPAADRAQTAVPRTRILVVDDNRDAADSLGMLLQCLGADVRVAHDGAEALNAVAAYQPAVVLLDIGMPGMDGYEVARRIRKDFPERRTPLVALTGWGQEEDRRRARDAGFDHHLIKPADMKTLQALLATLVSDAAPRSHAQRPQ
ncbi:MAG: ATP-binding protein [Betaproteobacteria bacterium]